MSYRNPEDGRARARRYYRENRDRILANSAAKRAAENPAYLDRTCSECSVQLEGRRRVVCSPRCGEARYRRLHPEVYAKNERRKVERRREARRAKREGGAA